MFSLKKQFSKVEINSIPLITYKQHYFLKGVLFILFFLFAYTSFTQLHKQYLNQNWKFRQADKNNWHKATIPGCVHTDLINNKLIADPYYRDNETKLQWINYSNWHYQTTFSISKNVLTQNNVDLVLNGLDTYAKVYLNGFLIVEANNMHRQWKIDIKKIAKKNNNILSIDFTAAQLVVDSLAKKNLPKIIPDNPRLYARKAQYQFGWDFAPKLSTCGIWKDVYIEGWSGYKLENICCNTINNTVENYKITISSTYKSEKDTFIMARKKMELLSDLPTEVIDEVTSVYLRKGTTIIIDTLVITNPKLWQPNGTGKQNLYNLTVHIGNSDTLTQTIGLRTIELVTQKDSISDFAALRNKNGTGFYFKVNNHYVYIKGANYVPLDMFPSSVTKERFKSIIQAAKDANMNMLRVWGGGIYEDDYFYQLCDEAGIMVWQDFMFAGSMLPSDTLFLNNIKAEAAYQVKRLQQHPSIALWCGNNEIDEAWHNWGWQKQFNLNANDSAQLWNTYKNIFHDILPNAVKEYSHNTSYWQSSPSIGWGRKESMTQGDSHYWGVWWGLEPIETYQKKVPRFMSEYGMQSMPTWYSIQKFSTPKDWDTSSVVMKIHQKHPTGYSNLNFYLNALQLKTTASRFSKSAFQEYVTNTQKLQSIAYKTAIEAHRSNQPYNMGTMLWQFNDCWPGASWSIIDYYGKKKIAYFQVKSSYQ